MQNRIVRAVLSSLSVPGETRLGDCHKPGKSRYYYKVGDAGKEEEQAVFYSSMYKGFDWWLPIS